MNFQAVTFLRKHSRQFRWTVMRLLGTDLDRPHWVPLKWRQRKTIKSWARAEITPWMGKKFEDLEARIATLNERNPTIFVLDIDKTNVSVRSKSAYMPPLDKDGRWRVVAYRDFITRLIEASPSPEPYVLAYDVADLPDDHGDTPVFTFQKRQGSANILLFDPDFFTNDWYSAQPDLRPFAQKAARAIFVGSSTGVPILTEDLVRNDGTPRLRLAARAVDHPTVDITIRAVVQCENPPAEAALRQKPYFVDAWSSLEEQFRNKFIISIDGNGPTCARVVHGLRANSLLLKHRGDDEHLLFYYRGLRPYRHYIPFRTVEDIENIMGREKNGRLKSVNIIRAAQRFAATYLSPAAVETYTTELIKAYAATVRASR